MKSANILIAQIGKGFYKNTRYARVVRKRCLSGDGSWSESEEGAYIPGRQKPYETGYTFDAVAHELKRSGVPIDTLILVGTESSHWGSLCSYYMGKDESGKQEGDEGYVSELERLKSELSPIAGKIQLYVDKAPAAEKNKDFKDEKNRDSADEKNKNFIVQKRHYEYDILDIEGKLEDDCGSVSEGEDKKAPKSVKEEVEEYLKKRLKEKFGNNGPEIQVKLLILKQGIDDEELQENFRKLQNGMEEVLEDRDAKEGQNKTSSGEKEDTGSEKPRIRLNFDISNGYRSLPVYIYAFANYLTRIRGENFDLFMYYGMAEAQLSVEGEERKIAPLVDLQDVNDLMMWINAVNEFRNFGSVRQILKIFGAHNEWGKIRIKDRDREETLENIFKRFDYATNSHNLKVLEETIDLICLLNRDNLQKSERETFESNPSDGRKGLSEQAVLLLTDIAKDFRQRFQLPGGRREYGYLTLRLAEWFFEQGRIGSAAIALQEGMLTYVMERFKNDMQKLCGFEPTDDPEKEKKEFLFKYQHRETVEKSIILSENDGEEQKPERKDDNKKTALLTGSDEKEVSLPDDSGKTGDAGGEHPRTQKSMQERNREIRQRIRNTVAHILYREVSDDEMEKYKEEISELIKEVLEDREKEHSMFEPFVEEVWEKEKMKRLQELVNELKNADTEIKEEELPKETAEQVAALKQEIQIMVNYEKNAEDEEESIDRFIEEMKKMTVLPVLIRAWITDKSSESADDSEIEKEIYRKRLKRKEDRKGKNVYVTYGSDRVLRFFNGKEERLTELLRSCRKTD